MDMTAFLSAARRRIHYTAAHLAEKSRGLDFTLPDRMYDRRRNDGAMYYASSPRALDEILVFLRESGYDDILDVGCGKGYVLAAAARHGFTRIGGVEYDERLSRICAENLRVLGLSARVSLSVCDAAAFEGYGDYDCFYFFNPFTASVMEKVVGAICSQCRGRDITLVYNHPRYPEAIERAGFFRRIRTFFDTDRKYEIYVYRGTVG